MLGELTDWPVGVDPDGVMVVERSLLASALEGIGKAVDARRSRPYGGEMTRD